MSTSATRDFLRAFEELGYRPLEWPHPLTPRGGWYAQATSPKSAKNVVYLDYKPKALAYSLLAGVFSGCAIYLLKASLEIVAKHAGHIYAADSDKFYIMLGWITFPVGLRLNWPARCIPNPKNRDSWHVEFADFRERILRPLSQITSPLEMAALLLKNEPVFEWDGQDVFMRTSYIIALLIVSGSSPDEAFEATATSAMKFADTRWSEGKLEPMLRELASFMWHAHKTAPGEIEFN